MTFYDQMGVIMTNPRLSTCCWNCKEEIQNICAWVYILISIADSRYFRNGVFRWRTLRKWDLFSSLINASVFVCQMSYIRPISSVWGVCLRGGGGGVVVVCLEEDFHVMESVIFQAFFIVMKLFFWGKILITNITVPFTPSLNMKFGFVV